MPKKYISKKKNIKATNYNKNKIHIVINNGNKKSKRKTGVKQQNKLPIHNISINNVQPPIQYPNYTPNYAPMPYYNFPMPSNNSNEKLRESMPSITSDILQNDETFGNSLGNTLYHTPSALYYNNVGRKGTNNDSNPILFEEPITTSTNNFQEPYIRTNLTNNIKPKSILINKSQQPKIDFIDELKSRIKKPNLKPFKEEVKLPEIIKAESPIMETSSNIQLFQEPESSITSNNSFSTIQTNNVKLLSTDEDLKTDSTSPTTSLLNFVDNAIDNIKSGEYENIEDNNIIQSDTKNITKNDDNNIIDNSVSANYENFKDNNIQSDTKDIITKNKGGRPAKYTQEEKQQKADELQARKERTDAQNKPSVGVINDKFAKNIIESQFNNSIETFKKQAEEAILDIVKFQEDNGNIKLGPKNMPKSYLNILNVLPLKKHERNTNVKPDNAIEKINNALKYANHVYRNQQPTKEKKNKVGNFGADIHTMDELINSSTDSKDSQTKASSISYL